MWVGTVKGGLDEKGGGGEVLILYIFYLLRT